MFLYVKNSFNTEPHLCLVPSELAYPTTTFVPYMDAPLMQLPRTIEEFRALRSSKYWRQLNRVNRKFDAECGQTTFVLANDADTIDRWLPAVHKLFTERWLGNYTGSAWSTEQGFAPYADAMKHLASENLASLAVLYAEATGELLSFSYNLRQDRTLYFYQHATTNADEYRKFGLGRRLLTNLMEQLVADPQIDRLDFMIGLQPYKLEWATSIQRVYSIHPEQAHESRFAHAMDVNKARLVYTARKYPITRNAAKGLLAARNRLRG